MTNNEQTILDLLPGPDKPGLLLRDIFRKLPADMKEDAAWDAMSELRRMGAVEDYEIHHNGGQRLVYRRSGVVA